MVHTSKTFRIFVSSTFSDLKEERNALQREVFPKLRDLCAQHGCRFQAIDLRWGVSEEAGLDQQTMKICLEEIERSQKVSPKPNFIVLLGDRYGWRPLPYEIPADEFEEIKQVISPDDHDFLFWEGDELSDEQFKKREGWYCRDENAVPPVYCLKPRNVEYSDNISDEEIINVKEKEADNWYKIENRLKSILLDAIDNLGWVENDPRRFKYESSATEQEIIHGVLNAPDFVPDPQEHVFAFFRNINKTDEIQFNDDSKDYLDFNEDGTQDESYKRRLESLKEKISNKLAPTNVFNYKSEWKDNKTSTDHLDDLCHDVYNSLETILLEQIKEFEEKDALDQEIEAHKEFGKDRSKLFIGRENNRDKIKSYLENPNSKPMVVYGNSGSGKSALMAKIIEDLNPDFYNKDKLYDDGVIIRFIGATPESSDIRSLLESLCREITKKYGADDSNIPTDYNELVNDFKERLKIATADKPLFIFLDALDQLSESENAHSLTWIPDELLENVHVVISTLKDPFQSSIENKISVENTNEVKPLEENEGQLILESWLKDMTIKRKLTPKQENEIINKFNENGLPLYLKLAFEEARRWRSYTLTPNLESEIPGIIRQMFERLSKPENHGEILVSHSLGYLSAAKNGLTEDEMLDILVLDAEVFSLTKKFHEPTEDKLPVALWSRLYFDLEPYLTERSADGTSLLAFYHRQLGEVAREEFLDEQVKKERHQTIANYFSKQLLMLKQSPNIRKVSELPYQQTLSEMWESVEETLTDLLFIEAKFRVGMGYGLLVDYDRIGAKSNTGPPILTAWNYKDNLGVFCPFCFSWNYIKQKDLGMIINCPSCVETLSINPFTLNAEWHPSKKQQKIFTGSDKQIKAKISKNVLVFSEFVQNQMHILTQYPELTLQQALNQPVGTIVSATGQNLLQKNPGLSYIQWINKSQEKTPWFLTLNHDSGVFDCAFSPDGKKIATTSLELTKPYDGPNEGILRIWDVETGRELKKLIHTEDIRFCAFSHDGKKIISTSGKIGSVNTLIIWDVETGKKIKKIRIPSENIDSCNLSPDGKKIIISDKNTVQIWDLETKKEIKTLEGHSNDLISCVFSPDGNKIASESLDTVIVWDIEKKYQFRKLKGRKDIHGYGLTGATIPYCNFSPDGKKIISTSFSAVRLWNIETGKIKIFFTPDENNKPCNFCVVSPDGKKIAATSRKNVIIWDAKTKKIIKTLNGHTGDVTSCVFSPDGKWIASSSNDKTVKIWDLESVESTQNIGHTDWVDNVAISQNGKIMTSHSYDNTVKIWDSETGNEIKTLKNQGNVIFSPDGKKIATKYRGISIWDVETLKELLTLPFNIGYICSYAFSPDGEIIALGSENIQIRYTDSITGRELLQKAVTNHTYAAQPLIQPPREKMINDYTLMIWDAKTGDEIRTLSGQGLMVFSPDGRKMASASIDNTIKIWDTETWVELHSLPGDDYVVNLLLFSPNGERLLVRSHNTVKIWDTETGDEIKTLSDQVNIVFSLDGGKMASSPPYDEYNTLKIWDMKTGKKLQTITGHSNSISNCIFSPSGEKIVTSSYDNTVKIWDTQTGNELQTLKGHTNWVTSCTLSPDGKNIITTSDDTTIRIWDSETGEIKNIFFTNGKISSNLALTNDLKIIVGDPIGCVYILHTHGTNFSIPFVTPIRLYSHSAHDWNSFLTTDCKWCGEQFLVDQKTLDTIQLLNNKLNDFKKTDEIWEDSRLILKCPNCQKKLRLTPFIIDNKEKNTVDGIVLEKHEITSTEEITSLESVDHAMQLNSQANLLHNEGKYYEAEQLYRQALEIYERVLGPENPDTLTVLNNLANTIRINGDSITAEPIFRQVLNSREKVLGPNHPEIATTLNSLGVLLNNTGKYEDAEPLYHRALDISKKSFGNDHPLTIQIRNNIQALPQTENKKKSRWKFW